MRKNVERIEDDRRIQTGVLKGIEAWVSVLADRHKLAIHRSARVKGLGERGYDEWKTLGEVLAVGEDTGRIASSGRRSDMSGQLFTQPVSNQSTSTSRALSRALLCCWFSLRAICH
jgi:hypothetical protein